MHLGFLLVVRLETEIVLKLYLPTLMVLRSGLVCGFLGITERRDRNDNLAIYLVIHNSGFLLQSIYCCYLLFCIFEQLLHEFIQVLQLHPTVEYAYCILPGADSSFIFPGEPVVKHLLVNCWLILASETVSKETPYVILL